MAVATIILASTNGDSVVISDSDDAYEADDIILDTDPKGAYATKFKLRTQSGAFEPGGRIIGEQVPIREMILPFHLTPDSRPRFQKLWGTPGNFQKVRWIYNGRSGPRTLTLRLSNEIEYLTEDGFDADIYDSYHAVVTAIAVNPMFEGVEDAAAWVNPDTRYTLTVVATGGSYPLTFATATATATTSPYVPYNATPAALTAALEKLPTIGAGNVTVTGTPGNYLIVFAAGVNGVLTGLSGNLSGTNRKLSIDYAPNTGWFEVWNPTDQPEWLDWEFDPAKQWQFPDFAFGQERKFGRTVGQDAARMIVTPQITQLLSVMVDPFMDTYVNADLSNASGLFNGVEPRYMVPPYTGTEDQPVLMPVICRGPAGAKVTLRQRRFWSAESGLEQ